MPHDPPWMDLNEMKGDGISIRNLSSACHRVTNKSWKWKMIINQPNVKELRKGMSWYNEQEDQFTNKEKAARIAYRQERKEIKKNKEAYRL